MRRTTSVTRNLVELGKHSRGGEHRNIELGGNYNERELV
jgi:hypothetical protein